ncbi:transcriptional regulator [Weissella oryzae SG25]|uniref:Transcriptional regulator n=2 Tax=Weissella TaxID=46255 RepID=A0A069CXI0_WEIOS|nr:transcriptional regulator [Weissella oryzae SG25]
MIINNEFKPYQAFFIGTNQHSLMFSFEPTVSVALFSNNEFVKKLDIKVRMTEINSLPPIGTLLFIDEIIGSELKGYEAEFTDGWSWDFNNYVSQFEQLYALKNVGNYQILRGSKNMDSFIEHAKFNGKLLKLLRSKLNLTQTEIGEIIGLTRQRVQQIEADNKEVSQEMVDRLVNVIPSLTDKVTIQLDWVSFNFPELNGAEIINNVLRLKPDLFIERPTSQNFYTREYAYAGEKSIYVQDFAPEHVSDSGDNADISKKGATLFLTGIGTRLFEKALLEQGLTWQKFFNRMYQYRGHVTRLDVAINDTSGLLKMNELVDAVREGRFWTKARHYAVHGSEEFGWTLDFGTSPFVIRMYDKAKEQEQKGKDTNIVTRVELELHGDKATDVIQEWLSNDNLVGITFDILYTYLHFVEEPLDEKKLAKARDRRTYIESLKPIAAWALLISLGQKMKFTTEAKEQSIESIENWISKYVAPSLKIIQETGRWQNLLETIREIDLSDDKKKLVQAVNAENMSIDSKKIPVIY